MSNQIFEILNNSSTNELIKIAANKNNEFNGDTVNYARQILEERKIDLADIPVEDTAARELRSGDEEIKKIKFKAVIHIIIGPILFLGGVVLFGVGLGYGGFPLMDLLFMILGARSIYFYFKLSNTAKTLAENRDNHQESSLTPEELTLVKMLNDAIILAKNGDFLKLETFLTGNINKQNLDRVTLLYQTEYYKDFIDEIRNISNQFSTIKMVLQPLIDMGLVDPKYPHNKI